MNQIIKNAVENKNIIEFYYNNQKRLVEPYCYGIDKDGKELLRASQVGGFSNSFNNREWKLFDVSKIDRLNTTLQTFVNVRHDYNPDDSAVYRIYANVKR